MSNMHLLYLKALFSISAPFSLTRLNSWTLSLHIVLSLTISLASIVLNPALYKWSLVAPKHEILIYALSVGSASILNTLGTIAEKKTLYIFLVISSAYSLRILQAYYLNYSLYSVFFYASKLPPDHAFSSTNIYF